MKLESRFSYSKCTLSKTLGVLEYRNRGFWPASLFLICPNVGGAQLTNLKLNPSPP